MSSAAPPATLHLGAQRLPSPLHSTVLERPGSALHQRIPSPAIETLRLDMTVFQQDHYEDPGLSSSSRTAKPSLAHSLGRRTPEKSPAETPLPYAKIFPLLVSRLSEGLIYSVIFPYINEMVHGFGVPEEKVGVWSAMAESALMVTEAITAPMYAPLADRLGRRPVFLSCLVCWGFFAVAFGLVQDVWTAIIIRGGCVCPFLQYRKGLTIIVGLLAGCGVLSRTMIGELCDKTNRVKGFAIFSPSLTVGVTLGPLVGGFLVKPVPHLLPSSVKIFVKYPYLLPSIVSGLSGFLAAGTGILLVPETLPASMRRAKGPSGGEKSSRGSTAELLRYKPYQQVLILYGLNNAIMFCWEALYPLFAFTRKDLGGLELSTQEIGVVLAFSALLSILMTIFIFPVMHRALPEKVYLQLCLAAYPTAVVLFPVLWTIHNAESASLGLNSWIVLAMQMVLRRIGDFAGTLLDTMVLDAIPGPEHLAMANSMTFSIAAVGRAIGPFIISWFFSLSTTFASRLSVGGLLVWLVFIAVSLPSLWIAGRMDLPGQEVEGGEEERLELMGSGRYEGMEVFRPLTA